MTFPNFLVIGAAKAGTTSLYAYLKQHPDIYMSPVKEPAFFLFEGVNPKNFRGPGDIDWIGQASRTWPDYQRLFAGVTHERAVGEATPLYLHSDRAAERIHHYLPDVKIIAILRDPSERAFSHFLQHVRGGLFLEKLKQGNDVLMETFLQVLDKEEERICNQWSISWHYKNHGFYARHLQRYFQYFPCDRLQVLLFDDFRQDVNALLRQIFQFLEVDETFQPQTNCQLNVSKLDRVPKNEALHQLLIGQNPMKLVLKKLLPYEFRRTLNFRLRQQNMQVLPELEKPHLTPDVRQHLIAIYREDILRLQDLLDRDLSAWLC